MPFAFSAGGVYLLIFHMAYRYYLVRSRQVTIRSPFMFQVMILTYRYHGFLCFQNINSYPFARIKDIDHFIIMHRTTAVIDEILRSMNMC